MMNHGRPAPITIADYRRRTGLTARHCRDTRLLDEIIWQARNARAATQILLAEDHPGASWTATASTWHRVAVLAAELRDRTAEQARS